MNINLHDYELILYDFWRNYNDKSGIQYLDAVNLGLEPIMYPFLSEGLIGEARLNFKIWNEMILSLFFQNDEGFFKINVFFHESYHKRYRAKDNQFDFKQKGILGKIFFLKISINSKGGPKFEIAKLTSSPA